MVMKRRRESYILVTVGRMESCKVVMKGRRNVVIIEIKESSNVAMTGIMESHILVIIRRKESCSVLI